MESKIQTVVWTADWKKSWSEMGWVPPSNTDWQLFKALPRVSGGTQRRGEGLSRKKKKERNLSSVKECHKTAVCKGINSWKQYCWKFESCCVREEKAMLKKKNRTKCLCITWWERSRELPGGRWGPHPAGQTEAEWFPVPQSRSSVRSAAPPADCSPQSKPHCQHACPPH